MSNPADIIKMAQHVLNGGRVQYWNVRDHGWKDCRYSAEYAPFDFNNTKYRITPNSVVKPAAAFHYFRKHVPSGNENRIPFSEFEYNKLGRRIGEGIPMKDAVALIERWNANLPEVWAYTLD